MNAPAGRNHRLFVLHHDVPGLLPFAHHMENDIVFRHFEVEVDFHPPLVRVCRHRIPHASGLQHRHAHRQLAGLQHRGMNELVDHPLVAGRRVAAGLLRRVRNLDQLVFIAAMRRRRNQIELCGVLRAVGGEKHFLRALRQVQAVLVAQLVNRTVNGHFSAPANVEHTALPAFQEILRPEIVPDVDALVDGNRLFHRHNPHRHHPVHVAVNRFHRFRRKQFFNQEFLPGFLRRVAFEIPLIAAVANIHVSLPHLSDISPTFSASIHSPSTPAY